MSRYRASSDNRKAEYSSSVLKNIYKMLREIKAKLCSNSLPYRQLPYLLQKGYRSPLKSRSGGSLPKHNSYPHYSAHRVENNPQYRPKPESTSAPRGKFGWTEPALPKQEKVIKYEVDTEQMIKELERHFDEKLLDKVLEKMNAESEELEKDEKTYAEINAKDVELDNDKKESDADRVDIEEKDVLSENISSEEKHEVNEQTAEKDSESNEAQNEDKAEALRDTEAEESVETNEKQETETMESMEDIIEVVDSELEDTNGTEELPIEPCTQDSEELCTELYQMKTSYNETVPNAEQIENLEEAKIEGLQNEEADLIVELENQDFSELEADLFPTENESQEEAEPSYGY